MGDSVVDQISGREIMRQNARRLLALILWLPVLAFAEPESPTAQFEKSILPAAGIQKTLLNVTRFGRYSIRATSRQGTALQLVDRMAGPGPIAQEGRLDAFLERGQYQVVTHGHNQSSGDVNLELRFFKERNQPQPPRLVEAKLIEDELHDLEQISYWIEVAERQIVTLEAAGRSLADMRLWKDGNWLMDLAPDTRVIYPKEGQPLLSCRLNAELGPGLYLLTAYGGASQPWAEESSVHPFYLRQGIPQLGTAGRKRFVVSPFGQDRFLVPGQTTYFRIELPEARTARIQVDRFNKTDPFAESGQAAEVSKGSIMPAAELHAPLRPNESHIVTITAEADQPYVLQHFESKNIYHFEGDEEYWISTIHSGFIEDSADATAILISRPNAPPNRAETVNAGTIEVGPQQYWHRRINLLGETALLVRVNAAGTYQLTCREVQAQYRMEPFLPDRPYDYRPPSPRPCGTGWDLDAGYHVLTITPLQEGIADLLLSPAGLSDSLLDSETSPSRGSVRFPRVSLRRDSHYSLYISEQPEVKAGTILRPLPIDLTDPLYIVQEPGEDVVVPFRAKEEGILRAEAEDGSLLEISVDGGPLQTSMPVDTALHTVSVRHTGKSAVQYNLAVIPSRIDPQAELPPISAEALAATPQFPVIDENTRQFGDLEKRASSTYLLKAEKPALYRLQSTGLLATAGNLRSRTNPSFVRKSQNGIGRNFSLQQYLREGDYLVTVEAEGESAGHYGLELTRTAIRNGGFLTSGIPARATLEPGQAIAYYFKITNPGEFRVRAIGEGRTFRCRLEDEGGWPVVPPDGEADISRYFPPGQYRIVILPEVTTARLVARIDPTPRQRRYRGHGPHALRLDERITHIWMESEGNDPRTPDRWDFSVPAPIEVQIVLTSEMTAALLRLEDSGEAVQIGSVMPGRGLKTKLETGRYRLEATALRKNNRAPYQVAVLPTELVTGLSRDINAPQSIPLSIGKTGLVELNSYGSVDVRAELYDSEGRLVAANDDRPDDWNFLIAQVLEPGRYRLEVKPAGTAGGKTTVYMLAPAEEPQKTLSLPARLNPVLRRAVKLYPLPSFSKPSLLTASVESSENVGLVLEAMQDGSWNVLAGRSARSPQIRIPLAGGASHRLRVWSLDRREMRITLRVDSIVPETATEAQLQSGISPVEKALVVKLDHPGLFRPADDSQVCWSAGPGEPCLPSSGKMIAAWNSELWIAPITTSTAPETSVRAERIVLSQAAPGPLQLPMRARERIYSDMAASKHPVLLLASSQGAQPVVQLTERNRPQPESLRNVAIAPRASASVLLGTREPAAAVWAGDPESAGLDVRLSPYYFPAVETLSLAGTVDGRFEGIRAAGYSLGSGAKRLHLALGNATVAVLSKDDRIESVHWQGGDPFNVTIDTTADRLTLLHTREEEDRYSVALVPLRQEELLKPLAVGAPYEQNHPRSGTRRLEVVHDSPGATLHVRGAAESVALLSNSGQVLRGNDIVVPPGGGTLETTHRSGLLLCWLDPPGNEFSGLWSSSSTPETETISLPATRRLLTEEQAFKIRVDKPVLLHVRMAAPSITLLKRAAEQPEVGIHPEHTIMEGYLPAGTSELRLRSIGGGPLSGSLELTASPLTPIGEGLGPEVLLAPGDSRLFSFEVKQSGPVGVGVRASSDVVETELLSSNGRSLGRGTVEKADLEPGIYLLVLKAPASGTPVSARPAVVGIERPSTGPPDDVIRKYLDPETASPQFSSQEEVFEAEDYEDYEEGTIEDVSTIGDE